MEKWQKEADRKKPGFFKRLVGERGETAIEVAHEEARMENKDFDIEQKNRIEAEISAFRSKIEAKGVNVDHLMDDIRNDRICRFNNEDTYELIKTLLQKERSNYHEIIIDESSVESLLRQLSDIPERSIVFISFQGIPNSDKKERYIVFDGEVRARSANSRSIPRLFIYCPKEIFNALPSREMFIASRSHNE